MTQMLAGLASLLLLCLILAWFLTAIGMWIVALRRSLAGGELLPAHRPLPERSADFSDLLVAIGSFMLLASLLQVIVVAPRVSALRAEFFARVSSAPAEVREETPTAESVDEVKKEVEEDRKEQEEQFLEELRQSPEIIIRAIVVQGIASVIACFAALTWMRARGLQWREMGFRFSAPEVFAGVLGVVMFLPPTYFIQFLLVQFFPYEHQVLDLLRQPQGWMIVLTMSVTTMLIAPLAEELFFRGILQGFFQSLSEKGSDPLRHGPKTNEIDLPPKGQTPFRIGSQSQARQYAGEKGARAIWPVVLSSLLFSAAHFGQGPAPIPLFFLALGLGYLYRQTASIWPGVMVHFTLNAITTVVTVFSTLL